MATVESVCDPRYSVPPHAVGLRGGQAPKAEPSLGAGTGRGEGFVLFQQQYGFKTLSQGPGALLDAKVARLVLTHLLQADKEEFSGAVLGQISSPLFSSLLHPVGRPSGPGCAEPGDRGPLSPRFKPVSWGPCSHPPELIYLETCSVALGAGCVDSE